jgi:hypothetical protein
VSECCLECTRLLNEGLNLCVRARKMDAQDRRQATLSWSGDPEKWQEDGMFDRYVERHNIENAHAPIEHRCITPQLWMQDQYDRDLAAWEQETRQHILGAHQ